MAVILVFGVGGMAFQLGEFTGLAGIVGVVLNLVLPRTEPTAPNA